MTLLLLRREQHLNRTLHNLVMDSTNKDEALQVSAQRECAISACLIDFFQILYDSARFDVELENSAWSTFAAGLTEFVKNIDESEDTFNTIFALSFICLAILLICAPCISAKLMKNCATFCCTLAHFSAKRRQANKENGRRLAETELEDWA